MKYISNRWSLSIAVITLMLCLWNNGMAAVRAESAETITEENQTEQRQIEQTQTEQIQTESEEEPDNYGAQTAEVPVLGRSSGTTSADVASSGGRKLDGIYYSIFTINGSTGYCLQSSKDTPEDAVYDVEQELDSADSFLSKAMYYAYGNPGYRPEIWVPDCPQDTERAYLRSHLVLSFIYDEGNTLNREVTDDSWLPWWKNYISETVGRLSAEPGVPRAGLEFSSRSEEAYFDRELKLQRTRRITLSGDTRNYITIALPEGIRLVNETKEEEIQGEAQVWGGDSFYLAADAASVNGDRFESGELYGSVTESWAALIVQTGEDRQDMGMGVRYPAEEKPTALGVNWIPAPELQITKNADREDKTYKKGEMITYTLEITQLVPKAVAKNLVIEDCILTEGVKLQKNSVVLLDTDKKVIKDAQITVQDNSIHIEGGDGLAFLEYVENGHRLYVEYQALIISDEMELIKNTAKVRSDNTPEVPVDEEVTVEKPKEELPEKPEKEVPPTKRSTTVQTGDATQTAGPVSVMCLAMAAAYITVRRRRKSARN